MEFLALHHGGVRDAHRIEMSLALYAESLVAVVVEYLQLAATVQLMGAVYWLFVW